MIERLHDTRIWKANREGGEDDCRPTALTVPPSRSEASFNLGQSLLSGRPGSRADPYLFAGQRLEAHHALRFAFAGRQGAGIRDAAPYAARAAWPKSNAQAGEPRARRHAFAARPVHKALSRYTVCGPARPAMHRLAMARGSNCGIHRKMASGIAISNVQQRLHLGLARY